MRAKKEPNRSRLIQAAMGRIPCDLTIFNVQFFNLFTGEIYPAEVDILDSFVVRVREEGQQALLPSLHTYDGRGEYLIPGFIDTHMHVESTMMIPENLSRAILPWGTTTICTDPHEIGNVMGIDGVRFMLENAGRSALRQYVLAPSCVPSVPGLESAGAVFEAPEIAAMLDTDNVIGIAEIMDFVGVYNDSERMHSIIDEGIRRDMFLQGHSPFLSGKELAAYRLGGPVSDHEATCGAEVREKLRNGFHVNLRASSLSDHLVSLVEGCKDHRWNDFVSICTDDVHAKDLLTEGHINRVVRKAISYGLDAHSVIKMATLNAAREYHFDDLGAIAPGYIADIQIVKTLDGCRPTAVFTEGRLIAENGVYLGEDQPAEHYDFPDTVDIPQITSADSFLMKVPEGYTAPAITVNVMTPYLENRILRKVVPTELPVKDGCVSLEGHPELCFAAIVNRYGSGSISIAVYDNFGLKEGALASTISHDCHNLTIAYKDPACAWQAATELKACGGGICAVNAEKEAHVLPLPCAGLMSAHPCAQIAREIEETQKAVDRIGTGSLSLMASAVMALPVLPGCIMTDLGIVDGLSQTFIPVFPKAAP